MNPLHEFAALFSNFGNIDPRMIVMWVVGGVLVYLAIKKEMEPTLLLPMGFGTILVNLPLSGAITQAGAEEGPISVLFDAGIANELFPLLLFIGIGAMIDFGPLLPPSSVFSSLSLWPASSLILTTPRPSPLSALPTAPLPSLWPIHCIPSIWAPLWWLRTLIWRWYPLSSRR